MLVTKNYSLGSFLPKTILLALFLIGATLGWSQQTQSKPQTDKVGEPYSEGYNPEPSECISKEQHQQVLARLDSIEQILSLQGKLPTPDKSTVYYNWPLRQKTGVNDPSYYITGNFVDENSGNGVLDYNCGSRTYDGHHGTDIGLWPFGWTKMANSDVEVIAAASGVIIDKVDGNYDKNCTWNNNTSNWNAVYVYHADGSTTWYGHLKSGSVTTKPIGATVSSGEYLGVVGSSGYSTGPHLHFEVYNTNGALVDPWGGNCNYMGGQSKWANQKPYYNPALCKLATHWAVPNLPQCPPESPNLSNQFQPGQTVYFYGYYRDRLQSSSASYKVLKPNGSTWQTWSNSSSGYYTAYYESNYFSLPSNAPNGTWTFSVTFNGQTYNHYFTVTNNSCSAPASNQIWASNITAASAKLNCNVSGVLKYDWQYRKYGNSTWIGLPETVSNNTIVSGLVPGIVYEFQVKVKCSNEVWSAWSVASPFTTLSGNSCNNPALLTCGSSVSGNNANGGNNFNCYTWPGFPTCGWDAPEMIYQFTINSTSSVTINLTGLSNDLDLLLLSSCNSSAVVAASGNSNNSNESIVTNNLPAGNYLLIVDGWSYATSNYTLSLSCNASSGSTNNEPCSATIMNSGSQCIPQFASNVGATQTNTPAPPSGCNSWNMKDVWFKVQIPSTGKFYVYTQAGTLTDAVIGIYSGISCSNLSGYYGCFDNNANGGPMPDLYISGTPGTWVYLRVWGVNGATGTFYICTQSVYGLQSGGESVMVSSGENDLSNRSTTENLTENILSGNNSASLQVSVGTPFPNPAKDLVSIPLEVSEPTDFKVTLLNLEGKMIGKTDKQLFPGIKGSQVVEVPVSDLMPGIYFMRIESSGGLEARKFVKQ